MLYSEIDECVIEGRNIWAKFIEDISEKYRVNFVVNPSASDVVLVTSEGTVKGTLDLLEFSSFCASDVDDCTRVIKETINVVTTRIEADALLANLGKDTILSFSAPKVSAAFNNEKMNDLQVVASIKCAILNAKDIK